MTFVLGVDGGGTKTHALVADENGALRGAAVAGPSNWEVVGIGGSGAALRVAGVEALEAAGVTTGAVEASAFGLAGMDWPSDRERLRFAVEPLGLTGPQEIVNDAFVALRAGASRPWGVVVIAGTGAVAAGRNPDGEVFRTLGLGAVYGDFGSASDVSVEAVRAVADAYTGRGPSTSLGDRMRRHLGQDTVAGVLEQVSRRQHGGRIEDELEGFAPVVIEAANEGDLVARDILERAGAGLGASAVLVARTLGMLELDFEIVLAGALITGATRFVSDPFEAVVRRQAPACRLVHLHAPPAVGAVLIALDLLGCEVDEDVRGRLTEESVAALWKQGS